MVKYREILQNPHFLNLALVIRAGFGLGWRRQHADVPFWTLLNSVAALVFVDAVPLDRTKTLSALVDLLVAMTSADARLGYDREDIEWLVSVLDDRELAQPVLGLLLAYGSAAPDLLTPAEVAGLAGGGESTWRARAASGEFPGAVKKGKTWLIPRESLLARGILVREVEDEER